MTRLPKKRGITRVEEDKSLILRSSYYHRLILIPWQLKTAADTLHGSMEELGSA